MKIVILVVPDNTIVSTQGRVPIQVQVDCSPNAKQVALRLKAAAAHAGEHYVRYLATAPN